MMHLVESDRSQLNRSLSKRWSFGCDMTSVASRVARLWLFLLAVSTLGAPAAFGDQFIVKQNGGGTHTTIQSAINDASDGDEIIVFPATFLEKINFLGKAIFVHGTDPSDPDVVDDTVIDASGAGHVVTFESGEPSSAVLEGFTIQHGSETHGGGIYCINGASPTIRRNVITQNFCVLNGSGIHCSDGASPYIVDNQILENFTEGRGGGVFCESSSARIEGNFIAENQAPGSSGGAVHLGAGTDSAIVIGNTMIGNLAVFGAGI
ncbi:MAG: right-handed parallel beta-helix repeat-containing protein, partial [Planctomycetes bacterium]|nr:right-handed parallel beta-helix repeat-containing protein [Planctomycetota bacterium]